MYKSMNMKKLISRYFSYYFLGSFETKSKAMIIGFLSFLTIAIIGVFNKVLLNIDNSLINMLFPFTYMGTISSILMNNNLKKNITKGCKAFEKRTNYTTVAKDLYEFGKLNITLTMISLFLGIFNLVFANNIVTFIIFLLLEIITFITIFHKNIFLELNKMKKIIITSIFVMISIIIAIALKSLGFNVLIEDKYLIVLTIMFIIIGFLKANSFINKHYSNTKKKDFVEPINNYDNLQKEEAIKEDEKQKKSTKSNINTTAFVKNRIKRRKAEIDFRDFCKKNYEENHRNQFFDTKEKNKETGYSTNVNSSNEEANRFKARKKR